MNQLILHNPAQAHQVLTKLWTDVKNELIAGNKQLIEVANKYGVDANELKQEVVNRMKGKK